MAIPVTYNLRNLVVRKTTTMMTALGVALTVAVLLAVLALVDGLRTTLASSGDPLQIIVLRKGSEWEIVGIMDAGRGAQASELWGDLNQVASDRQRLEVLSSALVRASDAVTAKALANDINNDQRLNICLLYT